MQGMSEADPIKRIVAPFVTHGICSSDAEALKMLAKDFVRRRVRRYHQRARYFRSFYGTTVEDFTRQVASLCNGSGQVLALTHLDLREQVLRAEDDLEEWEAAEQFLVRWRAVEADLQNASAA